MGSVTILPLESVPNVQPEFSYFNLSQVSAFYTHV